MAIIGEKDARRSTCCPQTSFRVSKAIPVIVEGMTSTIFYTIYTSQRQHAYLESEILVPHQTADGKYYAIRIVREVG